MTAVKIKPRLRLAVVGSPAYFERHPLLRTPADLKNYVCIRNTYPSGAAPDQRFARDHDSSATTFESPEDFQPPAAD